MRAAALALVLLGNAGCALKQTPATPDEAPAELGKALSVSLPRYPDGEPFALASDRGSVVLLDVWATWCEPCKDALPTYQELARRYGARGFKVYAINVDEDQREIAPFVKQFQVTLPILLDPHADVAERILGVSVMPTTFLLDRKGVLRKVHRGFAPDFLETYVAEIEALLAEPTR